MPYGCKKDIGATKEAYLSGQFRDKKRRSFISLPDSKGRVHVIRKGDDASDLREWCFARDGFMCVVPGCRTPTDWIQMHHIESSGKSRSDVISNVETRCVFHHGQKHPRVKWSKREK